MKRGLVFLLISVLSFSLFFSGGIFADDLSDCMDECKINFENETDRSPCINECKGRYGVENKDDLKCLDCGDACFPADQVAAMFCQSPINGKPICGSENGECIVLGFDEGVIDGSNNRCNDLKDANSCESREACESIWSGPSLCEGDVCTADTIWIGCIYKYDDEFKKLEEEYEEEQINPGITPDSFFYFLDDIFGGSREEKIAEVNAMVAKGDFESARKALTKYMEYAKSFEDDPDPAKREEARKSAAAIHGMLKKIKDKVSEKEKKEFYEDILDSEGEIITAVEISSKIKDLCVQLAKLDPVQYSKVCRTEDDDSPNWKRKLNEDLTNEQKEEAKKFGKIMSDCFRTSGQDCRCEEISFYDFSVACSKAAPLAIACDINGDEKACDDLDRLEMPELPDYLQDVMDDIEGEYSAGKYDMHMPPECIEAGVTSPKECSKIMIKEHSPLECRAALLDSGCEKERECREICDKIMFEKHAPQECIDNGIKNPKECAELMGDFMSKGPRENIGSGGFGGDCSGIKDSTKRLECYDNKGNEIGDQYGVGDKFQNVQGEITWQCKENRIHWPPDCETFMREEWPKQEKMRMEKGEMLRAQEGDWRVKEKECIKKCESQGRPWNFGNGECECGEPGQYYGGPERGFYDESECKDGCSQECGNQMTDCVNEKCVCLGNGDEGGYTGRDGSYEESECKDGCSQECGNQNTDCVNDKCVCLGGGDDGPVYGPGEGPGEPGDFDNNGEAPSLDSGTTSEPKPSSEPEPTPEPEPTSVTGEVIGNEFLEYYYR